MHSVFCRLLAGILIFMSALAEYASGQPQAVSWDVEADTWVATDALGRNLPTQAQVGPRRPNKTIGIFYFLWLGRHGEHGPFDISKILAKDPDAIKNPNSPLWGPPHAPHHWGESLFGYYVSDDDSVLRKHAQMLADAGVDVVIFDVTNQLTYPRSWKALCRTFDQVRRQGNKVPKIAFLCPFWAPRKVVRELWQQLYSRNLYPELWFRWEGKPLILADPDLCDDTIDKNFFTFRKPQPDYFKGPTGPRQWGWLEVYPQHVFYKTPGVPEQVTVGVAQNAADGKLSVMSFPPAHGRSFHAGRQPAPNQRDMTGRNFAEQWQRALEIDPPFIFITGWNEWIAGRYDQKAPFYGAGPVTFVDEFNQEYSRDIEPMKGGHGDNYYYQMVDYIRRYKGVRTIPPVQSRPISIDGRFADWTNVQPEFRDTIGDPVQRDYRGWGKNQHYTNRTGRNDIVVAKASIDSQRIYFYVRFASPRVPANDFTGTILFIDADSSATTGWLGYDIIVRCRPDARDQMFVEHNIGRRYQWNRPVAVSCKAQSTELELAIPRTILGLDKLPGTVDFKWADNIEQTGDWSDFSLNGDAAPNDRFNYRARFGESDSRQP